MTQTNKNTELSPMQKSYSIGHSVRHNFDWPNVHEVMLKVKEELLELEQSLEHDKAHQIHELGDVLFTLVQVARHLGIHPDDALDLCNTRHNQRMNFMKKLAAEDGVDYNTLNLEQLEAYWVKAKGFTKASEAHMIQDYLLKLSDDEVL